MNYEVYFIVEDNEPYVSRIRWRGARVQIIMANFSCIYIRLSTCQDR